MRHGRVTRVIQDCILEYDESEQVAFGLFPVLVPREQVRSPEPRGAFRRLRTKFRSGLTIFLLVRRHVCGVRHGSFPVSTGSDARLCARVLQSGRCLGS